MTQRAIPPKLTTFEIPDSFIDQLRGANFERCRMLWYPRCQACHGCNWACPEAPCGDPGDENDGPLDPNNPNDATELHLRKKR